MKDRITLRGEEDKLLNNNNIKKNLLKKVNSLKEQDFGFRTMYPNMAKIRDELNESNSFILIIKDKIKTDDYSKEIRNLKDNKFEEKSKENEAVDFFNEKNGIKIENSFINKWNTKTPNRYDRIPVYGNKIQKDRNLTNVSSFPEKTFESSKYYF